MNAPGNGVASPPSNGQHARPSEEDSGEVEPIAAEQSAPGTGDSSEAVESNGDAKSDRESRRIARAEKRQIARAQKRERPRAPRAEKIVAPGDSDTVSDDELPEGLPPATDASNGAAASVGATEALVTNFSGEQPRSATRTARRARSKQEAAAVAVKGADDHPALGALNRHLNMMTHQLETAHRVIGRVAAERDAFRQQLADLQGVPVEGIAVTSLGESVDWRPRAPRAGLLARAVGADQQSIAIGSDEPSPPSVMSRLNYFSVDDIAVARKRRQTFVLGLLVVLVVLWLASKMGVWQMPSNISKDSLTGLPFVGELVSYFLAGWILFRVVKISSKGVKWVFPSEDQKRRRR